MRNGKWLSFDDVLLSPQFSKINSRKDVRVSTDVAGEIYHLPIVSSNMDTVTSARMAVAMDKAGGVGCLHRFQSVEDNLAQFLAVVEATGQPGPWVSFGLGEKELYRADLLADAGACVFVLDVAHGSCMPVVEQVKAFRKLLGFVPKLIVGNFANYQSIKDFINHLDIQGAVDAVKVGIGGGSACTTRMVTGSGAPTFSTIQDCVRAGLPVLADGGVRGSGDFCKAIAAGASMVMMGGLLAGCDESPGEVYSDSGLRANWYTLEDGTKRYVPSVGGKLYKKYRGSASKESYEVQGKLAQHRTAEGDSFLVPYRGPVADLMQEFEAALRSAMSYSGAYDIKEFQERAEFIEITPAGATESQAHGRNRG